MTKIFPLAIIVLSLSASFVYFAHGNIKMGVYWFAAAIINICVTI